MADHGRILQIGPLKESLGVTLRDKYDALVLPLEAEARAAYLAEHGREVEVVVTNARFGVDEPLMDAMPSLRAVVVFGVGFDTTDVEAARRRGIGVSNTPDVLNACVADTAVALSLDVMRRLSAATRFVREEKWSSGPFPLTHRLTGARVGIVGLGRIGQAIAKRLSAFDCDIAYHSRHQVPGVPYRYVDSLLDLAARSTLLVVATAGGAGTTGLISREVLEAVGPQGYLVNISRGTVVDEPALVEALTAGRIAGAGLDVLAHEPHVPPELLALDNVVVLPHLASGTEETRADMERLALDNLESFLADGVLVTPVA